MLDSFCFSIPIICGVQFENEYEVEGKNESMCICAHSRMCMRMNEYTNVSEHMSTYQHECGSV